MNESPPQNEYFPVQIQTFVIDTIRSFDIYIKMKGRMVLYHGGGDRFTAEVKKNLIANHVSTLYIQKTDRDAYIHYLEENIGDVLTNPNISVDDKAEVAHSSITNIAEDLFQNPRAQTIARYKTIVSATMDMVMKEEGAISNLIMLTSHDFTTYIHSVNVGIFSIGLAKALLKGDPAHNMNELATGFFLHDIGKCETPLEVLNKPGPLNDEEWKIMRRHPYQGFRMLETMNYLTTESRIIVMQHHERNDGRGYPRNLTGDMIHLYSKICCIADVFDALTARRPYKEPKSPFVALQIMKEQMRSDFDPRFFERFVLLFSQGKISGPDPRLFAPKK